LAEPGDFIPTLTRGVVFPSGVRGNRDDHASQRAQSSGGIFGSIRVSNWQRRYSNLIGAMGDAGSFATGFVVTGALIAAGGVLALLLRLAERFKDAK
jgi:hypothetical protein